VSGEKGTFDAAKKKVLKTISCHG